MSSPSKILGWVALAVVASAFAPARTLAAQAMQTAPTAPPAQVTPAAAPEDQKDQKDEKDQKPADDTMNSCVGDKSERCVIAKKGMDPK